MDDTEKPAASGLARAPGWAPLVIVLGAIGAFVFENRSVGAPLDDAFIFFRYARNLVEGHGLVYNIGERVEGVTSLLWTLLIALGISTGADAVDVGHWLGVGSGALLLWLTYVYAAQGIEPRERIVAALAPVLLWLSIPFSVWAPSGMEAPLFAAAALAALVAEARGRPALAVVAAAVATLLRPEGALVAGVVWVFAWVRRRASRRALVVLLGAYVLVLIALTVFRLAYFGNPLPNTFYAKVGGSLRWWGPFYVLAFVVHTLLPALAPAVYAERDRHLWPGLCFAACMLVFILVVGGDVFIHGRFFLPILPVIYACVVRGTLIAMRSTGVGARFSALGIFVCIVWMTLGTFAGLATMAAAALAAFTARSRTGRMAVFVSGTLLSNVALAIFGVSAEPDAGAGGGAAAVGGGLHAAAKRRWLLASQRWSELERVSVEWAFFEQFSRQAAEKLAAKPPPEKLVATISIGAFGFYSDARVLDILGLVDPTIARSASDSRLPGTFAPPGHQRTNAPYVLARAPDYILIPPRYGVPYPVPALIELWEHPEFERRYRWDTQLGGYKKRRRIREAD